MFFAPRAGMGALVDALVRDLDHRGVELVPGTAVAARAHRRDLARHGRPRDDEGRRRTGSARTLLAADGVVVATPAAAAAALVRDAAPRAATLLAAIPYASVALVSLAVPREAIDRELDGSGFLVPRVEGRTITACSWTSSKWPHLAGDGTVWLRASVGRDGDDAALALDDADAHGRSCSPTCATRWRCTATRPRCA